MEGVPQVSLDEEGTFKYILIEVRKDSSDPKLFVCGTVTCSYHADILDLFELNYNDALKGCKVKCLGGGRIKKDLKSISVYGYSQGFGKADHAKSCEILKSHFPNTEISWSDEGY